MAPTQAAGGPTPDPAAGENAASDSPDLWGNDGKVGDGRYRLTHRLGRGGMAEVFAAEDVRLGRTVAVKLLRADLAEDPIAKARFTREAQSVAGLNHHAVVAVYDSGEDALMNGETLPFIVMEYVEGRTIRDLLVNAEAPPVDQALVIVSGVLEALAYSHQHGIVHRDIKPANVIITNTGAVKVMDFGIARALHGAASTMTQTGMVMGTPQYLSPEQALGRAVDTRSDLYATGCLLYELLALRPPFVGETPLSVVYQHVQDDPKVPSSVAERVPPELDGLVLRALAKEPDDRYQTAEEMRGEIQYALRMLSEEGAHSGTWATGHTGSTPQMGTPFAAAPVGDTQLATPPQGTGTNTTAQIPPPLLLGRPGGGGHGGGRRGGGPGWRKPALVAAAAVLAVGAGIFGALNMNDDGRPDHKKPSQSPTTNVNDGKQTTPEDQGSTDTGTDEGTSQYPTETAPDQQYTPSPSYTPSGSWPPSTPASKPPTTPTTKPPASSTPKPTNTGTTTGTSSGTAQGADSGTTQGGDGGGDDGGTSGNG